MTNYDQIEKDIQIIGDCEFYNEYLRIRIIINNLLSNAIKYQDIEKKHHFVKVIINLENPEFITIVFEDNGIGISEDVRDNIFDMFYRGTELADGSGLGLYIVKQTVEKLAGEIIVESKSQEGTLVSVKVPNRSPNNAVEKIH